MEGGKECIVYFDSAVNDSGEDNVGKVGNKVRVKTWTNNDWARGC